MPGHVASCYGLSEKLKLSNDEYIRLVVGWVAVNEECRTRVVHGSDGPAGRVGWTRGSGRVSILGFLFFFTDYFLVPESI